jgi:hypothetical protein
MSDFRFGILDFRFEISDLGFCLGRAFGLLNFESQVSHSVTGAGHVAVLGPVLFRSEVSSDFGLVVSPFS